MALKGLSQPRATIWLPKLNGLFKSDRSIPVAGVPMNDTQFHRSKNIGAFAEARRGASDETGVASPATLGYCQAWIADTYAPLLCQHQ